MKGRVTEIPELQAIGEVYDKSPAQVALRWELQSGLVTIPKSVHRHRIEENRDVFDFALTDEEMQTIAALHRGERIGPHPDQFAKLCESGDSPSKVSAHTHESSATDADRSLRERSLL